MASFAELLDKAMTEANIGNEGLAKHIVVEDTKKGKVGILKQYPVGELSRS